MTWLLPSLVLALMLLTIGAMLVWLMRRFPHSDNELIQAVDALLPQTQCAQCGYPGCLPYAEAVATQGEAIHLCAPGGEQVRQALANLFTDSDQATPPLTHTGIALINEAECIGCALCLPACPVDAIVGSNGYMHTVLSERCTGCELCIPACPVDCISLMYVEQTADIELVETAPMPDAACIRCGFCLPVCPVELNVPGLYRAIDTQANALQISLGMERCIECGLCDQVCPQELPLASSFGQAKLNNQAQRQAAQRQDLLKQQFADHEVRLEQATLNKQSRRASRMKQKRNWQP